MLLRKFFKYPLALCFQISFGLMSLIFLPLDGVQFIKTSKGKNKWQLEWLGVVFCMVYRNFRKGLGWYQVLEPSVAVEALQFWWLGTTSLFNGEVWAESIGGGDPMWVGNPGSFFITRCCGPVGQTVDLLLVAKFPPSSTGRTLGFDPCSSAFWSRRATTELPRNS